MVMDKWAICNGHITLFRRIDRVFRYNGPNHEWGKKMAAPATERAKAISLRIYIKLKLGSVLGCLPALEGGVCEALAGGISISVYFHFYDMLRIQRMRQHNISKSYINSSRAEARKKSAALQFIFLYWLVVRASARLISATTMQ